MALYAIDRNIVQKYGNGDERIPGMLSELYFRIWPEDLELRGWDTP